MTFVKVKVKKNHAYGIPPNLSNVIFFVMFVVVFVFVIVVFVMDVFAIVVVVILIIIIIRQEVFIPHSSESRGWLK